MNSASRIVVLDRPARGLAVADPLPERVDPGVVAAALDAAVVGVSGRSKAGLPSRLASSLAGFRQIAELHGALANELELELQFEEGSDTDWVVAELCNLLPALDTVERTCGGAGLTPSRISLNYRANCPPPPIGFFDRIAGRVNHCFEPSRPILECESFPQYPPFPGGTLATALTGCLMAGVRMEVCLRGPGGVVHPFSTATRTFKSLPKSVYERAGAVRMFAPCLGVSTPYAWQLGVRIDETIGQIAEVIIHLSEEQVLEIRGRRFASIRGSRT